MGGYTTREVARLVGLTAAQVRGYVRSGFLQAGRGARGELRFAFSDLVVLRAAKGLVEARIPARRVRRALRRLRAQLPEGRALAGVQVAADGDRVVVRDGAARWAPESGQLLFDFEVADLARRVAPLARRQARAAERAAERDERTLSAEDWYEMGLELEAVDLERARHAYRRALELHPDLPEAHLNLGRLLHEAGELAAAEAHYRHALRVRPDDAVGCYNLGVALEDQGDAAGALRCYQRAVAIDPDNADAHFNAARLYQRMGRRAAALRHLRAYRALSGEDR